jgi:hypothetical protein
MHPKLINTMNRTFLPKRERINRNRVMKANQTLDDLENVLYVKLRPPSKPKPPPFFEQAYCRRVKFSVSGSDGANSAAGFRPYSKKYQDDSVSYLGNKDEQDKESTKLPHSKTKSQLLRNPNNGKISKNNLKLMEIHKDRASSVPKVKSIASSKNRRLDQLRQKYMNQLTPTQKKKVMFAKKTIINGETIISSKKQDQDAIYIEDGKLEQTIDQNFQNLDYEQVHDQNKTIDEVKLDDIYGILGLKKPIDADRISSFSMHSSTQSKINKILRELDEERQKRKELETIITELRSKTEMSRDKLNK